TMRRVGIVVNSPHLQERRAQQFACRAERHDVVDVLIAPSPAAVARLARVVDALYVIDAGKRGFPAFALAKAARVPCVAEIGDPQAALYAAQGRSRSSVVAGHVIDRLVATLSDGVVVRGRALASQMHVRTPWTHLPDGVDLEKFTFSSHADIRSQLGISD